MENNREERRKYPRYDTELKIYYRTNYDIKTRVRFRILDAIRRRFRMRKYSGVTIDISVEGLGFISKKKLQQGDRLLIEVSIPNTKESIPMEAQVRWSKILTQDKKKKGFATGVNLVSVNGKPVVDSIYFDSNNHVAWSVVLEAVFGGFKKMMRNLKNKK